MRRVSDPLFAANLVWALLSYSHFIVNVTFQMSNILGIRVFLVKPEVSKGPKDNTNEENLEKPLHKIDEL